MKKAFTIVEMLIVIGVIAVLCAIVVPSLGAARALAKLASCGASMHAIHAGLFQYIAENNQKLPPFAFSTVKNANVLLSGHWGGASQPADPDAFGRKGVSNVNLSTLVQKNLVSQNALICTAADDSLKNSKESYFPYSSNYSTYCLRMPVSMDLFENSALPASYNGTNAMDIYKRIASSQMPNGSAVPSVMVGKSYESVNGNCTYDVGHDAMLADTFYFKQYSTNAVVKGKLTAYAVNRHWMHVAKFNVLYGTGEVRTVSDDGTLESMALEGSATLPDDGVYGSTYADKAWNFFDGK